MAKREIGRPQTAHIPPFGLRLQPELKERVEAASKASGRSMNAEIVARLEASFAEQPKFSTAPREMAEQIAEHLLGKLTPEDFGARIKKLARPLKSKAPPK